MNNNTVVILAGGFGKRMLEEFPNIPKPMIPINGIPILEHLINECVKYEQSNILLVLHHMPQSIIDYFGDGSKYGLNISYYVEKKPLGTGGALMAIRDLVSAQFFVLYADVFSDVNLLKFLYFHNSKNADISIVVHPNDHPYDSDIVISDSSNRVIKFSAHPHRSKSIDNIVNAALYIIDKKALQGNTFKKNVFDIAQDLFPHLLKRETSIFSYNTVEFIKDMGTPKRRDAVEAAINNNIVSSRSLLSERKAIFLDRDGTINELNGHIGRPSDIKVYPCSPSAISKINKSEFLAICITNQPVIARGECTFEEMEVINNEMKSQLGDFGAYLDKIYFCPHHTDSGFDGEIKELKINCNCRKPKPGMIIDAKNDFNINLEESWFIGDSEADIGAASEAGCQSILIADPDINISYLKYSPTRIEKNIKSAVEYILNLN